MQILIADLLLRIMKFKLGPLLTVTRSQKFSLSTGFVFTVLTKEFFVPQQFVIRVSVAWLVLFQRGSTIVSKT